MPFPLFAKGRDATFHPDQLGRDVLKAWWNPDDHGTVNMTDDGAGLISSWKDRLNGLTVAAITTARPTWTSNAFNSAYAGLTFDGTANCLLWTGLTVIPTGAVGGEIWASISQPALVADATGRYIMRYGANGAGDRGVQRFVVSGANRLRVIGSTTFADTSVDFSGLHIVSGNWAGTTSGGRIDGATTSPATQVITSINTLTTRLRIGADAAASAATFWSGVIRHVMITTTLSLAQQQKLEGWLAWDAALTSLLPATHPYKNVRP